MRNAAEISNEKAKKKRQEGLKCNVQTQVRRVELRVFPP